jgi:hypothetical protein
LPSATPLGTVTTSLAGARHSRSENPVSFIHWALPRFDRVVIAGRDLPDHRQFLCTTNFNHIKIPVNKLFKLFYNVKKKRHSPNGSISHSRSKAMSSITPSAAPSALPGRSPTIAIIGAGFSGTLLALHLLRRCPGSVRIHLIERSPRFGRGLAYSTGNLSHVLNVPTSKMSAFHDRPDDFLDWLRQEGQPDAGSVTPNCFVARKVFGDYVRHHLKEEFRAAAGRGGRLTLTRGEVLDLRVDRGGVTIDIDRGRRAKPISRCWRSEIFRPSRHRSPIAASTTATAITPIRGRRRLSPSSIPPIPCC